MLIDKKPIYALLLGLLAVILPVGLVIFSKSHSDSTTLFVCTFLLAFIAFLLGIRVLYLFIKNRKAWPPLVVMFGNLLGFYAIMAALFIMAIGFSIFFHYWSPNS